MREAKRPDRKFSVVTVNYYSWPYALGCLDSLYGTGYEDFEFVVVDNGREAPPEIPYPVRLIRNKGNAGFARACNQGIRASTGKYVVLVNPDTVVRPGFFEDLEEFLHENPNVGIAGPRLLNPNGSLQLSARKDLSFVSGLLSRTSLSTRLFPKSSLVKTQFPAVTEPTRPTAVDWVSGACMVVRRHALEGIGLMDQRFFMYFEDADVCRRAREAGWLIYYLPHIEVLHHTGASSNHSRLLAVWNLHKSAFLYHRKHGSHGPFNLYSLLVATGLCARALVKLAAMLASRRR